MVGNGATGAVVFVSGASASTIIVDAMVAMTQDAWGTKIS
jgi:hypothetical protein